jgi:UDPglucose 6-dehydrogenase
VKTVAIVGHGYVGRAHAEFFKHKFEVVLYDPPQGFTDRAAANAADFAVVCVPTEMLKDGGADVSIVEETLSWLRTPLIVIKSTVPPGTTARLGKKYKIADRLVFSPEFIGEGGYPVPYWQEVPHPTDMRLHSHFIFGGPRKAAEQAAAYIAAVRGPFAGYHLTDASTAELAKYMENCWIAAKVTFCNEFFDLAESFGVSYTALRELWLLDGRVGSSHTLVYPHKRGFDGKCIPKDINAMAHAAEEAGIRVPFLRSIIAQNERVRRTAPRTRSS